LRLNLRTAPLLAAALLLPFGPAPTIATAAPQGELLAGAARVDITPQAADLPAPFKTIHDPLFARAVVFDEGGRRAAIVVADVSTFAPAILTELRQRIADQIHAPASAVVLATTHNHSAVRIDTNPVGNILPGSAKVAQATVPLILQAVTQAAAHLQPARIGYAHGTTQLVARRDRPPGTPPALDDALADRTAPNDAVGVLRVDSLAGEPIAFVFNSGEEPLVSLASPSQITGDVAGAAERYIEQRYDDKAVALYTVGPTANTPYNARRQGPQRPADPNALTQAMGVIMGEDVLAAAAWIKPMAQASIRSAFQVLECPGKVTKPLNLPGACSDELGAGLPACRFTTQDNVPAKLEVGVLRIGEATFVQADADVAAGLWRKVGAGPNAAMIMTSYGPTHYVVEDADYPLDTYPATATMAKPGCAAQGFAAATAALMRQTR
jgi:hypothetical protein